MQTKKEFFEFENKTQKIFDDFYIKKGYQVKRIQGTANKDYDCEVQIDGKWYKIEEKFRSLDYNDCLVELVQDTETNSPGWIDYCKADYILYGVGDKIYCIDLPQLKDFVAKHKDKFNKKISKKGWGRTENLVIPWYIIKANNLGKRIK